MELVEVLMSSARMYGVAADKSRGARGSLFNLSLVIMAILLALIMKGLSSTPELCVLAWLPGDPLIAFSLSISAKMRCLVFHQKIVPFYYFHSTIGLHSFLTSTLCYILILV